MQVALSEASGNRGILTNASQSNKRLDGVLRIAELEACSHLMMSARQLRVLVRLFEIRSDLKSRGAALRVQARDAEIEAERTVKEAEAALQERDEKPRLSDAANEQFIRSMNCVQAWQKSASVCDDRCAQDGEGQRPRSVSP